MTVSLQSPIDEGTDLVNVAWVKRTVQISKETHGNEQVTTSTSQQDDDDLVFSVDANSYYAVDGYLHMGCTQRASGFASSWTLPSGATAIQGGLRIAVPAGTSATGIVDNNVGTASAFGYGTPSSGALAIIVAARYYGVIITAGSSGTAQFRWANQGAGGSNTLTVYADSWLRLTKMNT